MSTGLDKELDALLGTPLGKKPARRKKKKRASMDEDRKQARLREVERAVAQSNQWRLTAEPYETRLFVQRTYCISCRSTDEATISAPLIAYKDRIGRVHTQRTDIIPRHLPIRTNVTELRVPSCHHCALMCCRGADPRGFQLEFNFHKQKQCKALVPLHETPQAVMWIHWALSAEFNLLKEVAI